MVVFRAGGPTARHTGPLDLELVNFWAVHHVVGLHRHVLGTGGDHKGCNTMEVQSAGQMLVLPLAYFVGTMLDIQMAATLLLQ
jgi:hypothetical protein